MIEIHDKNSLNVSEERALESLSNFDNGSMLSNKRYFDEYGNYFFPTDWVLSTPNTATSNPIDNLFWVHNLKSDQDN